MSVPQMTAWLLTATVAPILCIAGTTHWFTVMVAALGCSVITITCMQIAWRDMPRWLCTLELVWLTVVLAGFAGESRSCWMDVENDWVIPLVVLLLAGFCANRGGDVAARVGSTLVWFVLPVLGIVLAAGAPQINPGWVDNQLETPSGLLISLFLIPALGMFLPRQKERKESRVILILGVIAVAGTVIMDGVLGANTAANAIYEFSKSVNLFGVAERFEAFVACVITAAWFALLSLLLSTAYHLTEKISSHHGTWGVWLCAAASLFFVWNFSIPTEVLGFGSLIFWGFLPVLTQGIVKQKKVEKT